MNSAVGSSFNLTFAFFRTCRSREQCTKPTEKHQTQTLFIFQCSPNLTIMQTKYASHQKEKIFFLDQSLFLDLRVSVEFLKAFKLGI